MTLYNIRCSTMIFVLLCSSTPTVMCDEPSTHHNVQCIHFVPFMNTISTFIKKYSMFIAAAPSTLLYKKEIIDLMAHRPLISAVAFYIALNYICDCMIQYTEQEELVVAHELLKKASLYLVVCHAIQNHINQHNPTDELKDQYSSFFYSITKDLPYSCHEIDAITIKLYKETKTVLQKLNKYLSLESEAIVFLCYPTSITLQTALYVADHDERLCKLLHECSEQKYDNLKIMQEYIRSEITKIFSTLNPNLFECYHNVPGTL